MERIPENFSTAVHAYDRIIIQNYLCSMGDERKEAPYVKEIKRIYTETLAEERIYLRYFALKTLSEYRGDDDFLGNWCREVALKLVNKLEKIT